MLYILTYLYNLIHNLSVIVKYYYSGRYYKPIFDTLLQLLKFNVYIAPMIDREFTNNEYKSHVHILVKKNNSPVIIHVKEISNQTNTDNHTDILTVLQKQHNALTFKFEYPVILLVYDINKVKLPENTVTQLKDNIKNLTIFYDKIRFIPTVKKNQISCIATQPFLGMLVSYKITSWIYNILVYILKQTTLYVDKDVVDRFNIRMNQLSAFEERTAWEAIKTIITPINSEEHRDAIAFASGNFIQYSPYEKINEEKHKKRCVNNRLLPIGYAYFNNNILLIENDFSYSNRIINFINMCRFTSIDIYNLKRHNELIKNKYRYYLSIFRDNLHVLMFAIRLFINLKISNY